MYKTTYRITNTNMILCKFDPTHEAHSMLGNKREILGNQVVRSAVWGRVSPHRIRLAVDGMAIHT